MRQGKTARLGASQPSLRQRSGMRCYAALFFEPPISLVPDLPLMAIWRGFFLFWNLALKSENQKPVFKVRITHLNVISQVEAALEGTLGNATMDELARFASIAFALAGHHQHIFLHLNVKVGLAETGNSQLDDIFVLIELFDIVGRVAITRFLLGRRVDHVGHTVKADNRAVIGVCNR